MTTPGTAYTPEEVVAQGKALYEQDIRAQVEAGNVGKYLVIDIETGDYEIGAEHLEAARRARAKHPRAPLYGMRIGYPATAAVGAQLRPLDQGRDAK